jgi:tetratricopeptide (TPR) repeat protein
LRGQAYTRSGRLPEAQREIEAAIDCVGPDLEAVARIHNLLGVVQFLRGHIQAALEQHRKGLRAAEDGMVKDLSLKQSIYTNLANAHWGLNDFPQAIRFFKEALQIALDTNVAEGQANVNWGLMMVYRAMGDNAQAKLCGLRALEIYEKGSVISSTASVCQNIAEMNIEDGQFDDARRLLERSRQLLEGTDELSLLGVLHQDLALLAQAEGHLEEAAQHAAQAIEFGEASCKMTPGHDMQTIGTSLRSYAESLHVAAKIEDARENKETADRLFQAAITTIERTSFEETRNHIIFSYADALSRWGEHQKASEYYKLGFRSRKGSSALRM